MSEKRKLRLTHFERMQLRRLQSLAADKLTAVGKPKTGAHAPRPVTLTRAQYEANKREGK